MVGYSKYTVMLEPLDSAVIKIVAMENDASKALTKKFLEGVGKTKLGELSKEENAALYELLVD